MLHQDECAELALIVLKQELAALKLDLCVAARDGDIINSEITFMATTQLENRFVDGWSNDVDNSGGVLLLTE